MRKRNVNAAPALFILAAFLFMPRPLRAQFQPVSSQTDFYFAHITDGGPSQGDRWTVQFRFVNPNHFPVSGTLRFFSTNGAPLQVDFGSGPASLRNVSIPAFGSIQFETTGSSPTLRTGFAQGSFDGPIQATSEFRNWRNGLFANGASVDGIVPNAYFWTFADASTGVALANPNSVSVSCTGDFVSSSGFVISHRDIFLAPFNQTAFTLGPSSSLSPGSVGSYKVECTQPVVSLAIAGNDRGITSSLPSGAFALPQNHEANIRRIFKHLVKVLNSSPNGFYAVGQPELLIGTGLILNAVAEPGRNRVTIWLALAELLADSPGELAYVIAHELGHIFQASRGLLLYPSNYELDADNFAVIAALGAGYDPYAAAGGLGKLAMVTRNASINAQQYDDLFDPHTSFTNRMIQVFGLIESLCSSPDWDRTCTEKRRIFHPHMPTPLREDGSATPQANGPGTKDGMRE